MRKTLSAYEDRVVSADANSWVQFRSECPMQGCVDNEANGEEEQDPRRLMFDTLKGMMKEWSDRTRPVPEFQRAYSPEERATFSSKPKSQSSDVYNHEQGLRDWGPPLCPSFIGLPPTGSTSIAWPSFSKLVPTQTSVIQAQRAHLCTSLPSMGRSRLYAR